jgi:hypothetical protein
MGLDSIELVMGFEEAFGFSIPDREASRLVTPRHVLEYAVAHLPVVPADGCVTQRTFYALRRGLRSAGVEAELRPGTPLRTLSDRKGWRVLWTRVRARAGKEGWPVEAPWPGWWSTGPHTLGDLARYVARHPPREGEPWTRERIELVIRHVVADVVAIDAFSMDDDFVRDLRID